VGAARHFPAVVVTGPRRAGKTTLLRQLFRGAQYVLLEDPDIQGHVRSDPHSFIEGLHPPVIFDEIQNTPELLNYVRTLAPGGSEQRGCRAGHGSCLHHHDRISPVGSSGHRYNRRNCAVRFTASAFISVSHRRR
jgi:hypothetical protein